LADPKLHEGFHASCREAGLLGGPADWNRELLRLRKAGAFPKRGEIKKVHISDDELDAYDFAAEIAWRLASDKFGGPSLDEILCDPEKAAYVDRAARRFAPGFESVQYRWAALRLRKASRQLVDDVKQYHFVFANRDFGRFQAWDDFDAERLAGRPGIYLLRADRKEQLFVGRTRDLDCRLKQHAFSRAISDLVTHVAILAGRDLPSDEYQAAFKEALVRRYQPRWNVNLVGLDAATRS
jgi:site-specific DNA-methyltransferase (adenine-specific)